jgi:hypothetical protein
MIKSLKRYRKAKLKWVRKFVRYFSIVDNDSNIFEWEQGKCVHVYIKDTNEYTPSQETVSLFCALSHLTFEEAVLHAINFYKDDGFVRNFKFVFIPMPYEKISIIEKTIKRRQEIVQKIIEREKDLESIESTANEILFK